ncbi:hypothetical protein O181_059600 [Austropuccinia psidii MF-1]|uniref:Uncharacterized protein n=1 Tax=Austropuccinia psidii MF-1 TaxID=1389203 RepID=A0A9Q3EBR4_9BASI|nr:hypothetical protein [Austropuccinia psidii MF-1]
MPIQDPNTSHAKPCTVNPYSGAAFQKFQQFLMPVQAPDASHTKSLHFYRFPTIQIIPYACAASQQLQHFLMWVQAPNASHANPYACTVFQIFTRTSLHLYRFPTIQTIPYAWEASQQFQKFLTQARLIACDHL